MNPIAAYLGQQGFLVLDGALATELERHGANLDDPLWSARCLLESPAQIGQVHMDYLRAGADVVTTATYQASAEGFRQRGLDRHQTAELLRFGVELAMQAREEFWACRENRAGRLKPLVAASMGPFGACLHDGSEYHGNYAASWDEVEAFHRSRLDILAGAGADILAFETIPSLQEAEILLRCLEDHPGACAWLSFSCRDEAHVSHGEPFRDCVELASRSPRVAAAGLNCTAPGLVPALLRTVRGLDCPLLVYPNSGETWVAGDNCWVGEGEGLSRSEAQAWYHGGARLIGGCCRTGPQDIARVRATLTDLTG